MDHETLLTGLVSRENRGERERQRGGQRQSQGGGDGERDFQIRSNPNSL